MIRPRVLLALTVYNGRAVVPAALTSVAALSQAVADIDVLVLDDCSPEPGFSDDVERQCRTLGHKYYRSPRNLGIPRNVNLGLLAALDGGYDYVIVSNSDVIYSEMAVDQLVLIAQTDSRIGSVTAWSTNVSIYSIPNAAPNDHLTDQSITNEVGAALRNTFGTGAVDIPAGISFAMLIPTPVLRVVGVMDPVFGRGYCEETDWSRRSVEAGFRLTLGVGAFVYHAGGGSTEAAGLLQPGQTTVAGNERIIDMRYPDFRTVVGKFFEAGTMPELNQRALEAIIGQASEEHGYRLAIGLRPERPTGEADRAVAIDVTLHGPHNSLANVTTSVFGFTSTFSTSADAAAEMIRTAHGMPLAVDVYDIGVAAEQFAHAIAGDGATVNSHRNYPARV
ncbi:glycosyltransferase family 2 protein [uncultured Ilumatobacter sp.]|jgi:GT2 family glycosyltransferase|uniref:glycosyltransferase family 2 protein n=1 Tax=uncultured Ilumatobacter sp. TaxID=879968 RepID=UPI00374F0545